MREAVAECDKPVMLYSIGKDSSVLLHLALKAFYPAKPPFPLLHVDTDWKFSRDDRVPRRDARASSGSNSSSTPIRTALARGIKPIAHGSELHTDVMKTQALRQALDKHGFDARLRRRAPRRGEARAPRSASSRSATRIIAGTPSASGRSRGGSTTAASARGESMRVFPLSNWTELDVWLYIHQEGIPVVPLYFAAPRPVVDRDGMLIMVDDGRLPLRAGETPQTPPGALPHARLLSAHRRDRKRRGDRRRHRARDGGEPRVRAARPRHRS